MRQFSFKFASFVKFTTAQIVQIFLNIGCPHSGPSFVIQKTFVARLFEEKLLIKLNDHRYHYEEYQHLT